MITCSHQMVKIKTFLLPRTLKHAFGTFRALQCRYKKSVRQRIITRAFRFHKFFSWLKMSRPVTKTEVYHRTREKSSDTQSAMTVNLRISAKCIDVPGTLPSQ